MSECSLPFHPFPGGRRRASLSVDCLLNELLEAVRERRVPLACLSVEMLKPWREPRVLEDRTSSDLCNRGHLDRSRCRVLVFHGFQPGRQMQQVPVVGSRLHVVAAKLEGKASLPLRLLNLLCCPSEECNFGAPDCLVHDAAGLFRYLRGEDAEEVLRARARGVLQNAKCEALDVVSFGCLLDDRHEGLEVPSDFLGFF